MDSEQLFPIEVLDHKRPEFEQGLKSVAVERYNYSGNDAQLETLVERNRNGRYVVEWVRGAWEGFNLSQTLFVNDNSSNSDAGSTPICGRHLVCAPAAGIAQFKHEVAKLEAAESACSALAVDVPQAVLTGAWQRVEDGRAMVAAVAKILVGTTSSSSAPQIGHS